MKIIHKQEEVKTYKYVPVTTIEQVPYYVTSDGKEFSEEKESEAISHERRLLIRSISVKDDSSFNGRISFHHVQSIQDIEDITYRSFAHKYKDREFPFWLGIETDDSDGDTYYYEVSIDSLQEYAEGIYASYLDIRKAVEGWVDND